MASSYPVAAHHKINYVEFASAFSQQSQHFFAALFGWRHEYLGSDYVDFHGAGLASGFYSANLCSTESLGGALIVFYSIDLDASLSLVTPHGGTIVKTVFAFPGDRRFHFIEAAGNEFFIWFKS